jgi:hypothetical protein
MNTDSFKQRQQLFQSGNSQSLSQSYIEPKPRLSSSYMNKDLFEPKPKNNNINLNVKKNITQDTPQKKINPSSNI